MQCLTKCRVCACGRVGGRFYGVLCYPCWVQAKRVPLIKFIAEWKSSGCVDCGFIGEPCQIDADHVLDGKTSGISQLVASSSKALARIKAELKLCVPRCRVCHRQVTRQRKPVNDKLYNPQRIAGKKRQLVWDFKAKHNWQCTDCKRVLNPKDGWDPSVLDLDHMPDFEKVESLGVMINPGGLGGKFSVEDVKAELLKVEVVCANCHPLRTAARRAAKKLVLGVAL
jgi:hypothetical protein